MLPYLPAPRLELGPVLLEAPGIAAALGFGLGQQLLRRRTASSGVLDETATSVWLLAAVGLGALTAYAHGALAGGEGFASLGAWVGVGAATVVVAHGTGAGVATLLTLAAEPAAVAFTLARTGCALAHDHLGAPSHHALAVAFPAGPRFDLGILEWLGLLLLLAFLAVVRARGVLDTQRRAATLALGYALLRLPIETLRVPEPPLPARAVDVAALLALLGLGVWLWWRAPAR